MRVNALKFSRLLLRRAAVVVGMSLEHRPVRIRFLTARRVRAGEIIHIPDDHRPARSAIVDMQSFVQLPPILRQFKCAAHFPAQRTLLIRHQLASAPVRQNLLLVAVRGLLQFPPVRVQQQLVRLIIGHIDFRILQFDVERIRGVNQLLQLGIVFKILPGISRAARGTSASAAWVTSPAASASRITSRISSRITTPVAATRITARVAATRALRSSHFLPRIITLIAIHFPRPGKRLSRGQFRRLGFRLRLRRIVRRLLRRRRVQNRPRRRLRIQARRTRKHRSNQESPNANNQSESCFQVSPRLQANRSDQSASTRDVFHSISVASCES